ncbi:MAG: ABC transporter ATP-binding protein [Chloroflexota bacterium]|nr:MAG: ABC transporter ATP-binding protein [Chloroflexota bacterium]HDD61667.1 ATP-binding cassette domain-containing protein [Chloroflexota bacterium]
MAKNAIIVENLSKRYRIGFEKQGRDTLAEVVSDWITSPIRNYRRLRNLTKFKGQEQEIQEVEDIIWALRDVSFEIKPGEVIGVIGKNGAGKSTLLKILSRITYPTHGIVKLNGRVSSLLEVGTGFHPELTGRDNIYLNGTILGMTRAEINRKFDEIVDFSGISKFIDTPVKFYSSGMGVRLAFSVAAHLEPEILLIDEVLSVGDAAFQKRSLGKMEEVSKEGRTVLFVSHNMGAVHSLCSRGLLLESGTLTMDDNVDAVINQYLSSKDISSLGRLNWSEADAPQDQELILFGIEMISEDGEVKTTYQIDEGFEIRIHYQIVEEIKNLRLYLRFKTTMSETVFATYEDAQIQQGFNRKPGHYTAIAKIPPNILNNMTYRIYIGFDSPGHKVLIPGKEYLEVDIIDTSDGYRYVPGAFDGPIRPVIDWQVDES